MALYVRTNKCCIVRSDLEYMITLTVYSSEHISWYSDNISEIHTRDVIYRSVDASNDEKLRFVSSVFGLNKLKLSNIWPNSN